MRPIPKKMREEVSKELRSRYCAMQGLGFGPCDGRIELHHVWIYAGKQINEPWAFVFLCHYHHSAQDGYLKLREAIMRNSLSHAKDSDLQKYPKKDWKQIKKALWKN